jgi:hypothetical protein
VSALYDEPARLAQEGTSPADDELLTKVLDRRKQGLDERKKYEPTWRLCESFLAGRHWVGWSERNRRVVEEPNPQKRERHTVNMIGTYHSTVLGKLYVEELRPDVLFAENEDVDAEEIATHLQKTSRYLWDTEVEADSECYDLIHKLCTYGTSALRCYFDPMQGPELGEFPVGDDGEPIYDMAAAREYMAMAMQAGIQPKMKPVREGRICWEALGPLNIIVPPGVEKERNFPWLMIERAVWLQDAKERWPKSAGKLHEMDLRTTTSGRDLSDGAQGGSPTTAGKLKEHTLITTYYEMPTPKNPKGRTIEFTESTILSKTDHLPYMLKGRPHTGITFFHYNTVDGRFLGKGVIEDLIGPNRQLNRARSQNIELKDRNLGRVYARKGTLTEATMPTGKIMELIEVPMHAEYPQEVAGGGIGPWVQQEAEINHNDMERVAGLHDSSMGQAPEGVEAFSAMALLQQADDRRVGPTLKNIRMGLCDSLMLTLHLAKRYWRDEKRIAIVGRDSQVEVHIYKKAAWPDEFYVHPSKQSPLPTSPAAEAQKIFDLFHAATSAGQPLPPEWLKDSIDAGRPLAFPKREEQVQQRKAEMEHYFMAQGAMVLPDPFDDDMMHLSIHRAFRWDLEYSVRSGAADEKTIALLEAVLAHEKAHVESAAMKAPSASVPSAQGGRGVEAQSGEHTNAKGAAQATSQGNTPRAPRGVR